MHVMAPETDANDHVPLEFLLGARVKYYYPDSSTASRRGRNSKAKRIFSPSIHPRRREEQARQLLQQVLDEEDSHEIDGPPQSAILPAELERKALLKVIAEAAPTALADQETIFDEDGFQFSFEDTRRSAVRIKTLQELRDGDLRRQNQRVTSFHGYEQDKGSFLDVTGTAACIPQTTTRQLRDVKFNVVKAKTMLEAKRTRDLLELLQEQQVHTRSALQQHKQLSKTLQQQKHQRVVSTRLLTLDNVEKRDNGNNTVDGDDTSDRRVGNMKIMVPLQLHESCSQQNVPEELMHPRRTMLATLNFDSRVLSSSIPKQRDSDGDVVSILSNNEEVNQSNIDADDDGEQVGKRLGDRQRGVFASSAANGLFLGGGFISKNTRDTHEKKANRNSVSHNKSSLAQASSESEFLEAVLGSHSASILPLAEANKPALRRRDASAGHRHSKNHHKPKE